jgi:bifunctional pyridoxal-dependent enzyme with beta-cystathionase and maltose regulon repressor activities
MNLHTMQLREVLLNEWKVFCDRGVIYDTYEYASVDPLEHHVRINLATTHANVNEAFDRIRRYFKK